MSLGGPDFPSSSSAGFNPETQPLLPENERETSTPVSHNPDLREKLRQFRSGFSGLPGRIRGHFQSLRRQPSERTPEQITGSAKAYAVNVDPPTDARQKVKLALDAEIAAYPYHRSLEKVKAAALQAENHPDLSSDDVKDMKLGEWDTARPLALAAGKAAGLSTKGSKGFIYDKKSGLTAYVMHNPTSSPKEVRIVFGGTTSGKSAGGLEKRNLLNGGFALKQWIANAKNAVLGQTPDSYRQARELTMKVQQMMAADPRYQDFQLTVSGHSKGGGEAAYATLSQKPPVHAICFSSAELGRGMRESFTDEQKAHATRYVTHYNIKGDVAPNVGKVIGHLGHIGKVVTLPAEHAWSSPVDRHDKFTRHINHFASS